ncbi:hypothetical protein RHSIM_Rhsim03G0016100 [Rhododendron simsii]|uniref:ARM repeat superfamily protein n=1 Tax=Rhododendron simsii TaxID=118357 RepID=A0A834H9E1_RHOSS|nr:hypothetical protein RHSIM_Rhsim03G0016100 [Rhododendron simsii]
MLIITCALSTSITTDHSNGSWRLDIHHIASKRTPQGVNDSTLASPWYKSVSSHAEISQVKESAQLKIDTVEDWNLLVVPLIDKLFAEPSNPIIVKFLSYISEQLADAADIVFHRILLRTRQLDEWKSHDSEIDNPVKLVHSLFDRLCPLLIIRLLPLRVFNNLNSSLMYGVLRDQGYFDINDPECVAGILLNRAFNNLEFDDVRKLAAELSGRIHPQVLLPIIALQLEDAANAREILKIKACLFALCTSFVFHGIQSLAVSSGIQIRGRDSIVHPAMREIRNTIETILLWPSLDGDEVSKAQHGCIDCLALMICTELQDPELFRDLTTKKSSLVRTPSWSWDAAMRNSVLSCVINQLTNDKIQVSSAKRGNEGCSYESSMPLSFRMCMANVLISACQKMPNSGKKPFARKVLPHLIQSVEMIMESEIRAAFVQVFFSAVYHLKSAVLPYASDLLKVSLKSLTDGSDKEKVAGAKLMASLMASEAAILESIARGLLDARTVLSSILSSSDTSPEVRQWAEISMVRKDQKVQRVTRRVHQVISLFSCLGSSMMSLQVMGRYFTDPPNVRGLPVSSPSVINLLVSSSG